MSNHVSVRLEMALVSVQDRCMVCAKRTLGLETVLDGDTGHVKSRFDPFGDGVSVAAR